MKKDLLEFFSLERQIFGICPNGGHFFRLSDCKIYQKKKPVKGWYETMAEEEAGLESYAQKTEDMRRRLQERAVQRGEVVGRRKAKKLDPVFFRNNLNPADAKVIFHPIDYIVFDGMSRGDGFSKQVVLLDRIARDREHKNIQSSIKRVVAARRYEWKTLTVQENGKIETRD